ncbi:MAG TPA: ABC transporter permease, partial [Candidatus Eisenbacteria bacterium]|nr:ABC transporter permease [Candidatus Eisenbacteria bacterium]
MKGAGGRFAAGWFGFLLLSALVSPLLFSAASAMDASALLDGPSLRHWFGTDSLGRDLLLRVLCGTGVSLSVGLVSVGISVVVGTAVGAEAGYFGG